MAYIEESMPAGSSQIQAPAWHGIKQSTLTGILKNKHKILTVAKFKNVSWGKEQELGEKSLPQDSQPRHATR